MVASGPQEVSSLSLAEAASGQGHFARGGSQNRLPSPTCTYPNTRLTRRRSLLSASKPSLNFQAQNGEGELIYVYYSDEGKKAGIGIQPIRRCVMKLLSRACCRKHESISDSLFYPAAHRDRLLEVLDAQQIKRGIFIYDGKLTPAAQKVRCHG